MDNSYYQIIEQISKNERSKHYNIFLHGPDEEQLIQNNEKFRQIESLLQTKFQVIFKLFGERNFRFMAHEYFKFNPIQSTKAEVYGKSFSDFLGSMNQLSEFRYLRWLAKLDWFWSNSADSNDSIQLPKGTLNSWASIYKSQNNIDIQIDESIIENLKIQKVGKEIQIVTI